MPVSRLRRPSPGSRRPGRWRRGRVRRGRARGRASRSATPSEVASSTNPNFSTLPPPDHGLQSRTGCEGRLARCTRAGGGGPEAGGQRRSCRQNGDGQEGEADERADEGLPVLGPGPQQSGDQEGCAHDHPDDPVPAARRRLRDGPPPSGDAEREPGRTESDVHAIADQEADHRDGEEQGPRASETRARTRARAGEVRVESATARHRPPSGLYTTDPCRARATGRRSLRCRWGVAIAVHHSLVFSLTGIVGSGRTA